METLFLGPSSGALLRVAYGGVVERSWKASWESEDRTQFGGGTCEGGGCWQQRQDK